MARRRLASVPLAHGDYLRVGGTATASSQARLQLMVDFILALAAILALLFIVLRDARTVVCSR